ncbi:unnamed protein product [Rotaria sp. Silwood1]|nr:unnamed protein product [Rotaria sp. Silwood1]
MMLYAQLIYCYQANLTQTPLKCYGKTEICRMITDFSYAVITIVIPIIVMIIFGLLTISNVQNSYRRICITTIAQLSKSGKNQSQRCKKTDYYLLLMLLVQIVLCCFFTLPQAIQKMYSIMTVYQIISPLQNAIKYLAFSLLLLLTYFSSGMPFYIYTLCGEKIFRQTINNIFKRIGKQHK